jgi:methylmalonyl-CoA mutase, C-terminal domain
VSTAHPSSTEAARPAGGPALHGAGPGRSGGPRRLRVVVAKPGLDGHDRGAKLIARAFRDAGFEVVYTGIFQTPEAIVGAVVQEDARVLGLSVLSGAHLHYVEEVTRLLREEGVSDVLLLVGGTIPRRDVPALEALGVARVFGPGTPRRQIVAFVREWAAARELPGGA